MGNSKPRHIYKSCYDYAMNCNLNRMTYKQLRKLLVNILIDKLTWAAIWHHADLLMPLQKRKIRVANELWEREMVR